MEKTPYFTEGEIKLLHQSSHENAVEKEYAEFIDIAVHDLDAPLRKLNFLVGMLTNKLAAEEEAQSYIERIENCVYDMRSLIDDLSVLAGITPRKKELTFCNIEAIIQQGLQDLPIMIKEKKAVITTISLPVIEGDKVQFRRLFK